MLASILSTLVNVNVPLAVPVLGGVFLAVAVGGQPSFLGVGLAMIGLGMALGLRRSC